jgi:hypothetical protein
LPGLLAPGPFEARGQCALPSVRPFTPRYRRALLRLLLTSRSTLRRRPFRREARPPQVRPSAFAARPPDLRRPPLVARASRSLARSPWEAPPCIRFLCVSPRFRSPLLSAPPSRSATLRFAPVPATRSREDLHLPVECHAGHTKERAPARGPVPVNRVAQVQDAARTVRSPVRVSTASPPERTLIFLGLASSAFGTTTSSTPSLYVALMWSGSIAAGRTKLRANEP